MQETHSLQFAPFRLDLGAEQLWRGEEARPLTRKAFAALRYLVEHAGQLVTKEALIAAVWAVPYVSDMALAACIREIRRTLDEQAHAPQFVETVRGRGYRFLAAVTLETLPGAAMGVDRAVTSPPAPAAAGPPFPTAARPQDTAAHPAAMAPASRAALADVSTPPVTVPHSLVAERRHLTVLCAGLVDATALASRMDPEE